MVVVVVVYAAALLLMGSVVNLTTLLTLTLLRASGSSVLTLMGWFLVSQGFVRRRGRAVSPINVGKMRGMAAVPADNPLLITHLG